MKTALCFYGQPRFYTETYDHLYKKLIALYNCDVFIHTYWNKNNVGEYYPCRSINSFEKEDLLIKEDTISNLVNMYSPKKILVEWYDSENIPEKASNYFQYYTQYAVKNIKKEYEKECNFIYDMIIRTRFDFVFSKTEFNVDLSFLNIPDVCPNKSLYCDSFSISNSSIFDNISDCFLNIFEFSNNGCGHEERAFKSQIDKHNIPVKLMDLKADILRSNKVAFSL